MEYLEMKPMRRVEADSYAGQASDGVAECVAVDARVDYVRTPLAEARTEQSEGVVCMGASGAAGN